jgi:2-dehydropantoate 2-reductase
MHSDPTIVVFGAGAVGATVGGWLAPVWDKLYFVDRAPVVSALRERGLTLYLGGRKEAAETVRVKAAESLAEVPRPDVIVLAVKNYSLESCSRLLLNALGGDKATIVALQNGVENQEVLPRHFSRVIYGVVGYNAWVDEPGVAGYQKRGPLVIGTLLDRHRAELEVVAHVLNLGVETVVTSHLQDAAHSKMIINLTNSLTTLIGHGVREVTDGGLFQKVLSNLTYEGVRIARAAGYRECHVGGMPSWALITAAARLPRFATRRAFEANVKKMVMSSMAQDVIQRGSVDTELESINGYFLRLSERHGVNAPFNQAVYDLCRERFAAPGGFQPMDIRDVWARVRAIGGA